MHRTVSRWAGSFSYGPWVEVVEVVAEWRRVSKAGRATPWASIREWARNVEIVRARLGENFYGDTIEIRTVTA